MSTYSSSSSAAQSAAPSATSIASSHLVISYSASDTGVAEKGGDGSAARLKGALQLEGYTVHMQNDTGEGTSAIEQDMPAAIEGCRAFIALCSPSYAVAGSSSAREFELAETSGRPIVPVWHSGPWPPPAKQAALSDAAYVPQALGRPLVDLDLEAVLVELLGALRRVGAGPLIGGLSGQASRSLLSSTTSSSLDWARVVISPEARAVLQKYGVKAAVARRLVEELGLSDVEDLPHLTPDLVSGLGLKPLELRPVLKMIEGLQVAERADGLLRPPSAKFQMQLQAIPVRMDSGKGFIQERQLGSHERDVSCVAISPDGKTLVSGSWDETLRVWDLAEGTCTKVLTGHTGRIQAVAVTPDSQQAVSGGYDQTLRVWDLRPELQGDGDSTCSTSSTSSSLPGRTFWVNSVAVSRDGRLAVTACVDRTVRLWDLGSRGCSAALRGHVGRVNCLALRPDGAVAVSGSEDGGVIVWDLTTLSNTYSLIGHKGRVTALALTPDGRLAISGGHDKTLRVWDLQSGTCAATLHGHTSGVASVAVTPDGRHAVSGSTDGTLRVWDLQPPWICKAVISEGQDCTAVAITPCGRYAVTGSESGMLYIWDLRRRAGLL